MNFTARAGANNVWGNGKNWRAAQKYDPVLQSAAGAVSSFAEDTEFSDQTYTGDAYCRATLNF
ncbi:MAG: hypothetical protein IPF54_24670 [Draconibacterium sp.]|nr:hypothetical protein [Draconibacterium sp.]